MKLIISILVLLSIFLNKSDQFSPDSGFIELARFQGSNYNKTYYVSLYYRAFWMDAFQFCRSSGMEFATFETEAEYQTVFNVINNTRSTMLNSGIVNIFYGAIAANPGNKSGFVFFDSGRRQQLNVDWTGTGPDFYNGVEFCASIALNSGPKVGKIKQNYKKIIFFINN
jgi:hypothetical protein